MAIVRGKQKRLGGGRAIFLGEAIDGQRVIRVDLPGVEARTLRLSQEALDALCDLNGRHAGRAANPDLTAILNKVFATR